MYKFNSESIKSTEEFTSDERKQLDYLEQLDGDYFYRYFLGMCLLTVFYDFNYSYKNTTFTAKNFKDFMEEDVADLKNYRGNEGIPLPGEITHQLIADHAEFLLRIAAKQGHIIKLDKKRKLEDPEDRYEEDN
jgi:hypothetical protein